MLYLKVNNHHPKGLEGRAINLLSSDVGLTSLEA